jgi:hypothetical protein
VTAFVVVFAAALLVLAGLVIDGGYALAAKVRAVAEADAAARAGVQAVDTDAFRRAGTLMLNRPAAQAVARAYLARTGDRAEAVTVDDQTVEVTVRISQPMPILTLVGVPTLQIRGVGRARVTDG